MSSVYTILKFHDPGIQYEPRWNVEIWVTAPSPRHRMIMLMSVGVGYFLLLPLAFALLAR